MQTQDCPWLVTVLIYHLFHLWSKWFLILTVYDAGVYAASKAGLEAGSDALRVELAHRQVLKLSYSVKIACLKVQSSLLPFQVHVVLLDPGYILEHTPLASRSLHSSLYFHLTTIFG